ncbi:MAG: MBL fold metallo-hydrolase [Candidatus Bathyarchaeota archaeon]|nr:MBL fold metallo-hydrolase [Candidatus Bathyarchaeota archaeon]
MDILFLGTSAAEGCPALFCECDVCVKTRILGGKNIRSRSSIQVDGELKIDWPPDTYLHLLKNNLNLARVKYLFITHNHYDHLHPDDLTMRQKPFAHMKDGSNLHIYGSRDTVDQILKVVEDPSKLGLILHRLEPFETVDAGKFKVTALPADHASDRVCLIYLIESRGKIILHGYDSGFFPEEAWQRMKDYRFDLVILDCTNGALPHTRYHMGLEGVVRVKKRMISEGIADKDTLFVATHFSHNGLLTYDELVSSLLPEGIETAYDGLTIEI